MTDAEDALIWLTDEEGGETAFRPVGRFACEGTEYAILEDAEDEGSVMVFRVEEDEEGEVLVPEEDGDLCEKIFYLFEADQDDYEIGPAQ